jgi:hypothetical protein
VATRVATAQNVIQCRQSRTGPAPEANRGFHD